MTNRVSDAVDFAARSAARAAASRAAVAGTVPTPELPKATVQEADTGPTSDVPSGSPPYRGEDLVAADGLAELGWDADSIHKLLSGPDHASIHELANPKLPGQVFHGTPGETGDAEADEPSPDEPSPKEAGETSGDSDSAPDVVEPASLYWPTAYGQGVIVHAIWSSLHGEPAALIELADNVKALPPVLQAYVKAASVAGKRDYVDLEKWMAAFDQKEARAAAERNKETKDREAAIGSAIAAAAAAVNAIPVVGQAISVALALSLAIREALLGAFPLPSRKAADQVHDGYEGGTCYAGISWTAERHDYLHTKQWVVQDPVASQLPTVPLRTAFPFAPTIRDFQAAVRELKLYDSIGRPDLNEGGNPDYSIGGS